ncbi:MAG: hypothetical protein JXJ20_12040 [Anaerolineae bacterium]|nr:hypothetical protein [Anaerolineae bacterium]
MPELIIVSFNVPPDNSPGAIRAVRTVEQLSKRGWSIRVIASRAQTGRHDPSLVQRWPANAEIIFVDYKNVYLSLADLWARWRARKTPSTTQAVGLTGGSQPDLVGSRLRKLISRLAYSYYYPDLVSSWIRPAVQAVISAHRQNPADVLFTTAGPWSTLFIGHHTSRQTGLPWVPDYRDPWTLTYSAVELMRPTRRIDQDRAWQQRFLDQCAQAMVVSEEVREGYIAQYHVPPDKIHALPIGFDDVSGTAAQPCYPSSEHLTISYVGNMALNILDPFLQALAEWLTAHPDRRDRIRLRFVGEIGANYRSQVTARQLDDITHYAGVVGRSESWEEICSSTVLLLLRYATEKAYCPGSKLYSYLASGRPVLAVIPPGSGARIVRESGQGIVAPYDDVPAIRQALDRLWAAWSAGTLEQQFSQKPAYVNQYTQSALMAKLDQVLRAVCLPAAQDREQVR